MKEEGKPQRVVTDHGTQFRIDKWRLTLSCLGVEVSYSSIRHPQSNSAERYMRIIGDSLRIGCFGKHRSWMNRLKEVEKNINYNFNTVTGFVPEEIQQGQLKNLPFETLIKFPRNGDDWDISKIKEIIQERIKKCGETRRKRQRDKNHNFEEGELVLVKKMRSSDVTEGLCSKLSPVYDGQYVVVKCGDNNSYLLRKEDGNVVKSYYVTNMRPYYKRLAD